MNNPPVLRHRINSHFSPRTRKQLASSYNVVGVARRLDRSITNRYFLVFVRETWSRVGTLQACESIVCTETGQERNIIMSGPSSRHGIVQKRKYQQQTLCTLMSNMYNEYSCTGELILKLRSSELLTHCVASCVHSQELLLLFFTNQCRFRTRVVFSSITLKYD